MEIQSSRTIHIVPRKWALKSAQSSLNISSGWVPSPLFEHALMQIKFSIVLLGGLLTKQIIGAIVRDDSSEPLMSGFTTLERLETVLRDEEPDGVRSPPSRFVNRVISK